MLPLVTPKVNQKQMIFSYLFPSLSTKTGYNNNAS